MQITDPVADMLTRIRNANSAKHDTVDVPASNLKKAIAQILLDEGYINSVVLCRVCVPDSGQHICYGIGDLHVNILLLEVTGFTREDSGVSGECEQGFPCPIFPGRTESFLHFNTYYPSLNYQLAFRTPGIWPL